jgi:predicted transcriptional regulator
MIALGLLGTVGGAVGGIWLAAVGLFVVFAAKAEEGGLRIRTAFEGREAARFMSSPAVAVPAGISVAEAVEDFFVRYRYTAFPVVEAGRPVGLIDVEAVERVPADRRERTSVAEVAISDPALVVDEGQDVAELLERPVFRRVGRAVVVTATGELGVLSITDVNRALRALDLQDATAGRPPG